MSRDAGKSACTVLIPRRADGRHARQVLRGHGHHKQRHARLVMAAKLNTGAVNTGTASSKRDRGPAMLARSATKTMAASGQRQWTIA
jgi:hypothetical protein